MAEEHTARSVTGRRAAPAPAVPGRVAARRAEDTEHLALTLPYLGSVRLPPPEQLAYFGAVGVVDSTYYTQITMVRTIEQILGAQPLNQKLAAPRPCRARSPTSPTTRPSPR